MFRLVCRLAGTFGVSGFEQDVRAMISDMIRPYVDEIRTDMLGNLIAVRKGRNSGESVYEDGLFGRTRKKGDNRMGRIMLTAHMDEIGVIVSKIDEKGLIKNSRDGGLTPDYMLTQRVVFQNGTCGVVAKKQKSRETNEEMVKTGSADLYLDIGADSYDEAKKHVNIGDVAAFMGDTVMMEGRIVSKALKNRAGCAVLIRLVKEMHDERIETDHDLLFVFTAQHELGLRGAKTASYGLLPDVAIVVDLTGASDIPGYEHKDIRLGSGPAIKLKDANFATNPDVRTLLENTARRFSIPYQLEISDRVRTDAGTIHTTEGGIPTGVVSIPCRYMHTISEMIDMADLLNCIKLLKCVFK